MLARLGLYPSNFALVLLEFARGQPVLPGDHRDVEPPDPIPNSEVKRVIADGSVGSPHVRVGHRQAHNPKPARRAGFFLSSRSRGTEAYGA